MHDLSCLQSKLQNELSVVLIDRKLTGGYYPMLGSRSSDCQEVAYPHNRVAQIGREVGLSPLKTSLILVQTNQNAKITSF